MKIDRPRRAMSSSRKNQTGGRSMEECDLSAGGPGGAALQPYELTLDKFIDHAATWHAKGEVVTGGGVGVPIERVGYAELRTRANHLSGALAALGLRRGDRIATLAWNSQAH